MHLAIQPLLIYFDTVRMNYVSAKVRPENLPATIAALERSVAQVTPYPFEYEFLDERFDRLYRAELRLGETFRFFTILALLIASLGLFGLAAFAAEQRTKEIGIRKVLGANVPRLVALLSRDLLRLVGIAFIAGAPLAYFAMQRWLEQFAYRIELGPGVFIVAGGAALVIALLAVSYQSVRAAVADPVQSLRYE
jgi:putative ABC transport system permease protein